MNHQDKQQGEGVGILTTRNSCQAANVANISMYISEIRCGCQARLSICCCGSIPLVDHDWIDADALDLFRHTIAFLCQAPIKTSTPPWQQQNLEFLQFTDSKFKSTFQKHTAQLKNVKVLHQSLILISGDIFYDVYFIWRHNFTKHSFGVIYFSLQLHLCRLNNTFNLFIQ